MCVCVWEGELTVSLMMMMMIVRVSELTECGGDVLAVWMDVFDGEDGEDQSGVVFGGPVDCFLACGHF